jgi:aspartate kinase
LQGEITTLGRGGSDTTAVAIGAKLGARLCEIYTDVEGVYTADPRIIKNAVKLNEVSHDEMLELATLGAKVLHNRSVELARKYNITLEVRSSMSNNKGTIVKGSSSLESMVVSGIVVDTEVARISLIGMKDEPGRAYKIFSTLSKAGICVDIIVQSIGRNRTKDITFTLPKSYLDKALNTLDCNRDFIAYDHYSYDDNIAKLSVVGAGMETNSGVASAMFEALYEKDINIHMISTSEIKISILVDKELAYAAANAIHDKFFINTIL